MTRTVRIVSVSLLSALVALACAGSARANFYMSRADAKASTRQVIRESYGVSPRRVTCWPPYTTWKAGYIYHLWNCRWHARPSCMSGQVRLIGMRDDSSTVDKFRWSETQTPVCE
jgi:hypothetical protein